jgi:copper chaperone CopZ
VIELIVLKVTGMKCGGCEKAVEDQLAELVGVVSVNASYQTDSVEIKYDDSKVQLEQFHSCLAGLNYPSSLVGGSR